MNPTPPGLDWADVAACTLPTAERPLRLAAFDDLFRGSLLSVERSSQTHARLLLAGGSGVAALARRLAEAEASCCSFFGFAVTEVDAGPVAFDIEVPTAYAEVLDGLVARAESAMGGAA